MILTACPYCGGGKRHDRDTFSLNLRSGAFQCFRASCGKRGHFTELCRDFGFTLDKEQNRGRKNNFQPGGVNDDRARQENSASRAGRPASRRGGGNAAGRTRDGAEQPENARPDREENIRRETEEAFRDIRGTALAPLSGEALAYLQKRGIGRETAARYGLSAKDRLLIFPFFEPGAGWFPSSTGKWTLTGKKTDARNGLKGTQNLFCLE